MQTGLIGKKHIDQLNWLAETWMKSGPPVCFLEGFPGTGKTTIARYLLEKVNASGVPTVSILTLPDTKDDPTNDLLLDLATKLSDIGQNDLADAVDDGLSLTKVFNKLIEAPILIVIDEFQTIMRGKSGRPSGGIASVLTNVASRRGLKGRVLLLTNRLVKRARWSEAYEIRRIQGMEIEDGVQLLNQLLEETEQLDEIPESRRSDVVAWLGGNPRAIRVLTGSLQYGSLDELIGLSPELWETKDRYVSEELVEELEGELLERTLSQLSETYNQNLNQLSVHRKPFQKEAIEIVFSEKSTASEFRRIVIDRFLMEQHKGWFNLHPIVREIGRRKLKQAPTERTQAHHLASRYFTRHFLAKQMVGWGKLGGYFVEARYHLVNAGREEVLGEIATRFENYIRATIHLTSPVPKDGEELDERIAVLSALLAKPGAKGLEYHLARCLQSRNRRNDLERAIKHARRATGVNAPADSWLLCANLLAQSGKTKDAIKLLKKGITQIPAENGSVQLYQSAGELLAQSGKTDEAIALLKKGIDNVPISSVFSLYQSAGELLAQSGQTDEAIALLKQGIDNVPASNVSLLYQSAGELLAQSSQTDEAIALLKQGIDNVPRKFNRYKLIEPLLNLLLAKQDLQALDGFLAERGTLALDPPQLALANIYRLILLDDWTEAARLANQKKKSFLTYRPVLQAETFCWLCAGDIHTANETLQQLEVREDPFEPVNWLRAWVALKLNNFQAAREALATYLGRAVDAEDVSEQNLLRLWDTPPLFFKERTDLAYHFPILPSSLTGLPHDLVRTQYSLSVAKQFYSHTKVVQQAPEILPVQSATIMTESEDADWPSWMDGISNPSEERLSVDVGIVIALQEEFDEIAPQISSRPYYNSEIKQYYYLFERTASNHTDPYRCVVTFIGSMGPTDAGMVGDRLIAQFNPGTIVSIGIAGSMDRDVLVGDVIVADQTDEYLATSKAIETENDQGWEFQFSGNPYKTDPTYVTHAANFKYAHKEAFGRWGAACRQRVTEWIGTVSTQHFVRDQLIRDLPAIQTGHIASGSTVGAVNKFVQWLRAKRDRKFIALEMESAGVLNAAHKRAVSSLIIRGISDYSDDRKAKIDGIGEGALRRYAMNNALELLWVLMDLELIKRVD
ncbi:MAG: AAA family ATPase [Spirulinaceae cyanobacterium]